MTPYLILAVYCLFWIGLVAWAAWIFRDTPRNRIHQAAPRNERR